MASRNHYQKNAHAHEELAEFCQISLILPRSDKGSLEDIQ
jgi:hypothetical protein